MDAFNTGLDTVNLHPRMVASSAETIDAFNTGLDAVNLHPPDRGSDVSGRRHHLRGTLLGVAARVH